MVRNAPLNAPGSLDQTLNLNDTKQLMNESFAAKNSAIFIKEESF